MNIESIKNFINGEFIDFKDSIDNFNPATGKVIGQIARSNQKEIESAIAGASKAQENWSDLSIEERAHWADRIADNIEKHLEEYAQLETLDTGKPISVSKSVDIPRAISNFRFFAELARQRSTEAFESYGALNYTQRMPLGCVALITPWNLPLYLLSWKLAPALIMGNTVIAKPSEVTPMTAMRLGQTLNDIGFPKGVVQIVHGLGSEVGEPLVINSLIKGISFTGSTATGSKISSLIAGQLKKTSFELGGKNPTIVFADSNIEKAVEGVTRSAYLNQGQICLCGSRIFVEHSIYEDFKEKLIASIKTWKIGDPSDPSTKLGALVSKSHYEKVLSYMDLALKEGGKVLTGGDKPEGLKEELKNGYFISPILVENLSPDSRCFKEEVFGPYASIHSFNSEQEVLTLANDVEYGLSASVWTENLNKAQRVSQKLDCGMVWVNTWLMRDLRVPFGGVKSSGLGREGGHYSFDFFSQPKNICFAFE